MFAGDLAAGLTELRTHALARMTSRVTIRRKTGATVVVDRMEVPVWETLATGVPFRLGGTRDDSPSRTVTVGDVTVSVAVRTGNLPAGYTDVLDEDCLDITHGENAGAVLRVVEATWQDQATARRVPVVQVPRPAEWS